MTYWAPGHSAKTRLEPEARVFIAHGRRAPQAPTRGLATGLSKLPPPAVVMLVPTAQDAGAGPPKAQLRGTLAYEDLILGG